MVFGEQKTLNNFNVCLAALFANLCATAATCVMSWSSPALPMLTVQGKATIFVTNQEGALLSSIPALGACFGPFLTSRLTDGVGRKSALLMAMALLTITWAVLYFSAGLVVLLFARFLAGVCAGCVYGTLPMYISEISPIHLRGPLGALLQFFDCIGYMVEYIGGSYVSYKNLILLSAALPVLCIATFMWVPESPYYLQNNGREEEALKALVYFRGNADVSELKREVQDMEASAKGMRENNSTLLSLFTSRGNLKSVYYAAVIIFFQQASGINVVTFYSKTIFEMANSFISANLESVVVAVVMTVASVVTITSTNFFTLRQMLTCSSVGLTVSMLALGTYFFQKGSLESTSTFHLIPIISLVVFIFTYTLGFGPLPWVITSAIFPSHLKAVSCSLCSSFMWFLTFILTLTFTSINTAAAFWIFGAFSFLSFFFVRFQLPDIEGKSFQEIQDMIQGKLIEEPA